MVFPLLEEEGMKISPLLFKEGCPRCGRGGWGSGQRRKPSPLRKLWNTTPPPAAAPLLREEGKKLRS